MQYNMTGPHQIQRWYVAIELAKDTPYISYIFNPRRSRHTSIESVDEHRIYKLIYSNLFGHCIVNRSETHPEFIGRKIPFTHSVVLSFSYSIYSRPMTIAVISENLGGHCINSCIEMITRLWKNLWRKHLQICSPVCVCWWPGTGTRWETADTNSISQAFTWGMD